MPDAFHDRLKDGALARAGLLDDEALRLAADLLHRVRHEGLETVRLGFVDQHGIVRGKALVADALLSAFRSGVSMTSTLLFKDTSHRTVFPVWSDDIGFGKGIFTGAGDALMVPDPATFRILPWAPHSGWILCSIHAPDGGTLPFCSRTQLARAQARLATAGYSALFGLEQEFHIFRVTDPNLRHDDGGFDERPPDTALLNHGYEYLTEARYDAAEPVLDDLRRHAQALNLPLRSMEIEFGPSQFEFTFDPGAPLAQADVTTLFRAMVRQTCARAGLHATFMCLPRQKDIVPSGWHVHQSLSDAAGGTNLFMADDAGQLPPAAGGWIAGLLARTAETALLLVPTINGYKRFRPGMMAPDRIQWARDNKGAMIRALMKPGDPASRIENRLPEPAANPYLAFAAQIHAGLDGVQAGLHPPAPAESPYASAAPRLPGDLSAAIQTFEGSDFVSNHFGADFRLWLATLKRAEWDRYRMTVSDWEQREYFTLF
ncbi:MAG: glutamine synthetase family protein [Pararhodobacter sp.]